LSALGMPAARAAALSSLAAAAAADGCLFSPRESLEAAIAKLRALRGIGEWTAQYIAMRALREPDAFPAADIGLMRAMSKLDGKRPSASTLLARAEAWRPWRAYAAQHLWSADTDTEMSPQPRRPTLTEDEADAPMLVA
jgi:AraC family transcriptional regulator, regulatory protein of adaptative response / DNA-3-methyladenine glycosylase II